MMAVIKEWLKELLIFFLLINIILQINMENQTKQMIRSMAGIMFLLVFLSPVFRLFENWDDLSKMISARQFMASYYAEMEDADELWENEMSQVLTRYADNLGESLKERMMQEGIDVEEIVFSGNELQIFVAEQKQNAQQIREIAEEMLNKNGVLGVGNIEVIVQ